MHRRIIILFAQVNNRLKLL